MPQYGWHFNIDNCIACRACETACKQEYLLPVGVRRRFVVVQEGVSGGSPYRRHISMACLHCADPACLSGCPVSRYWKDDSTNTALRVAFGMDGNEETGLVLIKPTATEDPVNGVDCIRCKRCIAACPYGAPQYDETTRVVDKCTGCYHRLFNADLPAERRIPACVVTCTSMTLNFDDMTVIDAEAYGTADLTTSAPAGAKELADPSLTNPSVRFSPQTNIA